MNRLCLILFTFFLVLVKTGLGQGAKLIEMANNKYAFVTDLSRVVRVQPINKDPETEEERNVVHFIREKGNEFYIQFSTKRFLCAKKEQPTVVSCKNIDDENTIWKIEKGRNDRYLLKNKNGKCLRIGSFDKRKASEGIALIMGGCDRELGFQWGIRKFSNDTESSSESSDGTYGSYKSVSMRKRSLSVKYSSSKRTGSIKPEVSSIKGYKKIKLNENEMPRLTETYTIHLYYKPYPTCIGFVPVPIGPNCSKFCKKNKKTCFLNKSGQSMS